jgi:SAM-dependent methyltransferase
MSIRKNLQLQPFLAFLPESARILDVGCGSGRDALAFNNKCDQVDAIDYSEELVKKATRLIELRQCYSALGLLRRDSLVWLRLAKDVARTVKDMPVLYLKKINGQNFGFLYQLDRCGKQLILLAQVMFCLR